MKSYKIHLLRHGETEANEKGLYIGRTDLPLSPAGLQGLLRLREGARYPGAARFFTSPLTRCRQTLEVLYPHCRQEVADGLAECDFGEWEGKSAAALQNDPRFGEWIAGKRADLPGGEAAADFQARVTAAFSGIVQELMTSGDTEAVVCTHGGVIMLLMAAYALPRLEMHAWAAGAGEGFTLRITPTLWMREPVAEFAGVVPQPAGEAGQA